MQVLRNNHSERRDERSHKDDNYDITHKIKVEVLIFHGVCDSQPKPNIDVHGEPLSLLEEAFLLFIKVEETIGEFLYRSFSRTN